jgi:hypothetical protein
MSAPLLVSKVDISIVDHQTGFGAGYFFMAILSPYDVMFLLHLIL